MSDFQKASKLLENGLAFGISGASYMDSNLKIQIRIIIQGWLCGQEKDSVLHASLNELEDISGCPSWILKICDDIRLATRFEDAEERDRYIEVIRPRIRALLSQL